MTEKKLNTRIQLKTDSEKNWGYAMSFIPKKGEPVVYQLEDGSVSIKVGDGTSLVYALPFVGEGLDFITTDDIDEICGATITNASEVEF